MKSLKVILIALSILSLLGSLNAQDIEIASEEEDDKEQSMSKKGRFMIGMGNDIWMDAPGNVNIRNYNPSFVFSFMFDSQLGKSPLTFGAGLGLQSNNLYSDGFIFENQVQHKTAFNPIPDSLNYDKNKISTTYLELPVELRLRLGKEKEMTISAGFKVGYLINSHTKYKGENYLETPQTQNDKVKIKEHNISDLNKLRYTATGRIGYKSFSLFAHYNLTPLFEEDQLIDLSNNEKPSNMYLITAGIIFSPF
ncbi:MAG: PorT family protein [Bacteroidales bacterium]|nr:PorT family protein [Bacteroidales bacterium]